MDWMALLAITFALLLICFFSGIEIAFVSANRLAVELKKKQGSYIGKTWATFMDRPARFIGTILICFNVVLVIYGLLWSNVMNPVWESLSVTNPYLQLLGETVISTVILLFFEFIFKAFFRAKGDAIIGTTLVTSLVQLFYSIFAWIAAVFVNLAEWILKYLFNVKLYENKDVFSKLDLEHFVQQSKNNDQDQTDELNNELFENVLSLGETKVRECLIPRREIEAVEINMPVDQLKQKFIDTQLSKLVVYQENIDNIQGYIHQLDLFKNPSDLSSILLPIPAVPESMSATDLMSKFSKERKTIAWVVDEFGGTAGIVTMEDLLEEIFGDIHDEYDTTEEFVDKQLSSNEYIFSGRVELDFIQSKYNIEFMPDEESETLSGYIISNHGSIPKHRERIILGDFEFEILNVSDTRIETVKMKILR
jgi:putative hemolysin